MGFKTQKAIFLNFYDCVFLAGFSKKHTQKTLLIPINFIQLINITNFNISTYQFALTMEVASFLAFSARKI